VLRTNLSTRPFYNERAVLAAIGVVAFLTAALTAFNVAQVLTLTSRNSEVVAQAESSEARAAELREQARKTQQALNREDVDAVQSAAREANQLIDRRAFSWTLLFNQFEDTLPVDVRIVAVTPQIDREGRMLVAITVVARQDEDVDTFIDLLRGTGSFAALISRQDETQDDGTTRAVLQGYYTPVLTPAKAASSPPASDSNGDAGNQSPGNTTPPVPPREVPKADRGPQ
jgi:hypothetical protein